MFCFKCGTKQADDAVFCGACGTKLPAASQPAPEVPLPRPAAPIGEKAGTGRPTPADTRATKTTTASASPCDAALTVETWTVTCRPPDDDGDSWFTAKAVATYEGAAAVHLARLRFIAWTPDGRLPLGAGETDVVQDIDEGDEVELVASSICKVAADTQVEACSVTGQLLLFPGSRHAMLAAALPEAGDTGGHGARLLDREVELSRWRIACVEVSEESASYKLNLVLDNAGASPLAAVTLRVRVSSRKGDVWATEFLVVENLAPSEVRAVDTTLWLSERARARKGAMIEVVAVTCRQPVLTELRAVKPTLDVPESGEEESRSEGDESEGGGEDSSSDLQGMVDRLVREFEADPRNKIRVGFDVLLASAIDETGREISGAHLKRVIHAWLGGSRSHSEELVYDGAVAVCGTLARRCWGTGDEDEDVDYSVDWVEESDGTFSVVVRPN